MQRPLLAQICVSLPFGRVVFRFLAWGLGVFFSICFFPTFAQETVGPYPIYRTISPTDGLSYQTATSSVQDRDGTYWIGCPVGVQRFVLGTPSKLYRFGDTLAPQSERWAHLLRIESDSLFAYTGTEVHTYDRLSDTWKLAFWKVPLRESQNRELRLEKKMIGVPQYAASKMSLPLSLKQELPAIAAATLLLYDEGRGFLGTSEGLYELRKGEDGVWVSVSGAMPLGLNGISIEGLSVDREGNLLIGTAMYSVIVVSQHVLKNQWLALPEGTNEGAWGIAEGDKGKFWVSTRQAISTSVGPGSSRLQIDSRIKLPKNSRVNHLSFQKQNLFIGTTVGVFSYSKVDSGSFSKLKRLGGRSFIYRITPSLDDGLDVYVAGQMFSVDFDGNFKSATGKEKPNTQYYDGLRASDGSFWLAGVKGLWRADRFGESLVAMLPGSKETSSAFPVIRAMETQSGNLYFASLDGGLWQFEKGGHLERVVGKGQAQRSLYAAEVDTSGRVWMGTNKGLACYVPKADQWHYFTPAEGYPVTDHNQGSSLLLSDGRLAFGGAEGVLVFNPDSLLKRNQLPTIGLARMALDDVTQKYSWPYPNEILYDYKKRRLDLSFALLGALDTVGLIPEIRISGKDKRWRKIHGMRLDLDGMAYGKYIIETRVRDRQTDTIGVVSSASLLRPPPWYATWWARGLMTLGTIGLVGFVWSKIVTQRLRRKLEKMELENRINTERVRIARDLHDNVGSTLTYLTTSLRRMKDQTPELEVQTNLNNLQELSQDTLWQLRETIWAASHQQVTLGEFSERLGSYLRRIRTVAKPAELRAILPTEASIKLPPGQGLYMFRIVQESLTNAIKYASAKQILVKLVQVDEVLELEILDDGIGFDERTIAYSSGVTSIRERAKEMGAEAHLETSLGAGTKWTIRFPLNVFKNMNQ